MLILIVWQKVFLISKILVLEILDHLQRLNKIIYDMVIVFNYI